MGVNQMTGQPWHKERIHRADGDARRYKGRCQFFDYDGNFCDKKKIPCYGSAHCEEYDPLTDEEYNAKRHKYQRDKAKNTLSVPTINRKIKKEEPVYYRREGEEPTSLKPTKFMIANEYMNSCSECTTHLIGTIMLVSVDKKFILNAKNNFEQHNENSFEIVAKSASLRDEATFPINTIKYIVITFNGKYYVCITNKPIDLIRENDSLQIQTTITEFQRVCLEVRGQFYSFLDQNQRIVKVFRGREKHYKHKRR